MSVTMVHPRIAHGRFVGDGEIVVRFAESEQDADAYFHAELEQPVLRRADEALDFYRRHIARAATLTPPAGCQRAERAPTLGHHDSGATTRMVSVLRELFPEETGGISDPCSVHFYDRIHYRGDSFRLGGLCCERPIDADHNLARRRGPGAAGGWDEAVSSVDRGNLVGVTLLFDQPDFRGDRLELWSDVPDLTRIPRFGHTGNWNDRACSIACAAASVSRAEAIAHCCATR